MADSFWKTLYKMMHIVHVFYSCFLQKVTGIRCHLFLHKVAASV